MKHYQHQIIIPVEIFLITTCPNFRALAATYFLFFLPFQPKVHQF